MIIIKLFRYFKVCGITCGIDTKIFIKIKIQSIGFGVHIFHFSIHNYEYIFSTNIFESTMICIEKKSS